VITSSEISRSAVLHGHDLLRQGFSVSQVVHDYGDVCQAITELAVELNAPISTDDFRTLNRCLDDAIAGAGTEYGRARTQSGIDGESARGSERLGYFAHELRNLMNTAIIGFEVLKTGNLASAGAPARCSSAASWHHTRSSVGHSRRFVSRRAFRIERDSSFLNSSTKSPAAILDANARGVRLTVMPVEEGVAIEVDRQVLAAVVANLLQNAFKFTRPETTVTLRVGATTQRVLIEMQDECGGLPGGNVNELFRPFEQRSADRTGVGLGLAFSRWGAEANDGRLYARDLPDRGCVFTVDLPRVLVPAVAAV
jgi:signal transduction histidine kinase